MLTNGVAAQTIAAMLRRGVRLTGIALCVVAMTAAAAADPAAQPSGDSSEQIVFMGLLPLTRAGGKGNRAGLRRADDLRAIVENALTRLTHQPVLGQPALTKQLGKGFGRRWFDCRNDVPCLTRLLKPMRDARHGLAIAGDYYVVRKTYHVHLVAFRVDGTVLNSVRFEITSSDVSKSEKWPERIEPLLASWFGHIHVTGISSGATCAIDEQTCVFEQDGETIRVTPGEHSITATLGEHESHTLTTSVEAGATQEVAFTLEPPPKPVPDVNPKQEPESPQPAAVAVKDARRRPRFVAVRTDQTVEIDGKLDEAAWQKANVDTAFTQNFPDEGKAPSERTELRVLYDDDAIYVGIRCYDSLPDKIVSRLTRRDRDIESDKVIVDVSSRNDHATSYTFQVNAAGVQVDGTRFNDTGSSTNWDGVWYSGVTHDRDGWVAELAIPLAALRYTGDTSSFGFQVRRYIQRRQEIDEWSYIPREAKGEVSYYGTLDGLDGLNARRLVQIAPYTTASTTVRLSQAPYNGTSLGGKIGGDVKIGLTHALTLDATVLPDFGTVEVDQVILNLSTFETEFPEKRPFFLEGADLFDTTAQNGILFYTSMTQFYTRRVGRTPPDTGAAGEVVDVPPTGEILGATKVTGFLADRLSIGVMDAVTSKEDIAISRVGSASTQRVVVDPLTNFGLVRLRQEFGVNSSIGVMATSVNRDEAAGTIAPMPGDACPIPHVGLIGTGPPVNGRCTNDAYTGGIDTILRTGDGEWGASGQLLGSVLDRGPDRIVPDGTHIKPGDLGWGTNLELGKYGGEHWLYQFHYLYQAPELELNDAGYDARANEQAFLSIVTLRSTKPALGLQETSLNWYASYDTFADTHKPAFLNSESFATSGTYLQWFALLPSFWSFTLQGGLNIRAYNNRMTGDGALVEIPSGYTFAGSVKTDPRKSMIAEITAYGNKTERGAAAVSMLSLALRPASFIEVDVISDFAFLTGEPRWVTTVENVDASRTYYFQDLDVRFWDVLLRGTLALSPRLSLQTYGQLSLIRGHYGRTTSAIGSGARPLLEHFADDTAPAGIDQDFRDTELNINVFLRWEYRPGSALWLGYTRNEHAIPYDAMMEGLPRLRIDNLAGPSTDVLLVKLSYLWEPLSRRH